MPTVKDFALHLRARLLAQATLTATLTKHPTLIGTGREQALANLLREFIPRRFEVLSGTVVPRDLNNPEARQIDVMIADTIDYPTALRAGELAVVLPESVRAVVEVKSDLGNVLTKKGTEPGGETFYDVAVQLGRLQSLFDAGDTVFVALFSYGGPTKNSTLAKYLRDTFTVRERRRVELKNAKSARKAILAQEIAALAPANLPEMIAIDTGAIALKVPILEKGALKGWRYTFHKTADKAPPVIALVEQIVSRLAPAPQPDGAPDLVKGAPDAAAKAADGSSNALQENKLRIDRAYRTLTQLLAVSLKEDAKCTAIDLKD